MISQMKMNNEILKLNETEEFDDGADIRGDVLEYILCKVPLIHLIPASHVSKSWNQAVFSSLRHFNKLKPWLIVHAQGSRHPHATTTLVYDPRSSLWVRLNHNRPSIEHVSPLRSSYSTLLYMLSPSKFSLSLDPLHLTWHILDPPRVWRTDPIVAVVGRHVVVAGGVCDFEDDPLSVEIYDLDSRNGWNTCESMPVTLKDSAASTWLSFAANTEKLYVMDQASGVTHLFDPISRTWPVPFDLLRHDHDNIYFSVIAIYGDSLIMVALIGNSESVTNIKVWEVKGESLEFCKEIGVMPEELVEKLKGEREILNTIKVSYVGEFLYVYNPEEPGELVVCENGGEGICRWASLKNAAVSDGSRVAERLVLTCAHVGLDELDEVVGSGKGTFNAVGHGILQRF